MAHYYSEEDNDDEFDYPDDEEDMHPQSVVNDDDDDDNDNDALSDLPDYVVGRVERLRDLNTKRDKFMADYLKERAALELKYYQKFEPLYTERALIVQGDKDDEIDHSCDGGNERLVEGLGGGIEEVTLGGEHQGGGSTSNDDGGGAGASSTNNSSSTSTGPLSPNRMDSDNNNNSSSNNIKKEKGIPQFWVCAMSHMEDVGSLITEEDVDCLECIRDITCIDDEDGKGFTLRFYFHDNIYFHDTVLTKRYEVPNLLTGDEPILKNVIGCSIKWKANKSLTYKSVKKKQRGKGKNSGQVRTVTKKEYKESFFNWFDPPSLPCMEAMDQDEVEKLEETFDSDYDVAQSFRLHIVPKAVLWFTGEAADQELEQAIQDQQIEHAIQEK